MISASYNSLAVGTSFIFSQLAEGMQSELFIVRSIIVFGVLVWLKYSNLVARNHRRFSLRGEGELESKNSFKYDIKRGDN